jgi:hypothetical protein
VDDVDGQAVHPLALGHGGEHGMEGGGDRGEVRKGRSGEEARRVAECAGVAQDSEQDALRIDRPFAADEGEDAGEMRRVTVVTLNRSGLAERRPRHENRTA